MPFVSKAQQRWGNSPTGVKALGGANAVKEWNQSTNEKKIPKKIAHPGVMKKAQDKVKSSIKKNG